MASLPDSLPDCCMFGVQMLLVRSHARGMIAACALHFCTCQLSLPGQPTCCVLPCLCVVQYELIGQGAQKKVRRDHSDAMLQRRLDTHVCHLKEHPCFYHVAGLQGV